MDIIKNEEKTEIQKLLESIDFKDYREVYIQEYNQLHIMGTMNDLFTYFVIESIDKEYYKIEINFMLEKQYVYTFENKIDNILEYIKILQVFKYISNEDFIKISNKQESDNLIIDKYKIFDVIGEESGIK